MFHLQEFYYVNFFTYLRIIYTFVTITKCQHTTRVMATHHVTLGGSGEPLQIPINEVFTFQGHPINEVLLYNLDQILLISKAYSNIQWFLKFEKLLFSI